MKGWFSYRQWSTRTLRTFERSRSFPFVRDLCKYDELGAVGRLILRAHAEFGMAGRMQKETRDELERQVRAERMARPELASEPK